MNIRSRLLKSLELLTSKVLTSNDPTIVAERLREWYQLCLSGIRQNYKKDLKVIDWFLSTPSNELPITKDSIEWAISLSGRYKAGQLSWSINDAFGMITELAVHRDRSDCCPFDQGDLEYFTDEQGGVAKLCSMCGTTMEVSCKEFTVSGSHPSTKSELRAVGLLPDDK